MGSKGLSYLLLGLPEGSTLFPQVMTEEAYAECGRTTSDNPHR